MQYPEEFKQKVLSTCNNNERVKEMVNSGSEFLGRYLDEASQSDFTAKEIVEACESMNLQVLYQKAKLKLELQELYSEWLNTYEQQKNNGKSM